MGSLVDEIFYTDLPDEFERDQILRIHCKKRGIDMKKLDGSGWSDIISKTDKFVGAELEQVVCDARFSAFARNQTGQPTIDEFLDVISKITPIADGEKENIEEIRKLAEGKARPVSKPRTAKAPAKSNKRTVTV